LDRLREPVNAFFDDVMVMVEDAAVRANRIALLSMVDALYKALADFTKVVVA
jgi:glycyl-tRNA synthetase beta chain